MEILLLRHLALWPVYIVSSKLDPRPRTPNIYNLQPDDDVMMFGHQMRGCGQMEVVSGGDSSGDVSTRQLYSNWHQAQLCSTAPCITTSQEDIQRMTHLYKPT